MIEGVSVPKEAYISEIDAGWLNFRGKSTKNFRWQVMPLME